MAFDTDLTNYIFQYKTSFWKILGPKRLGYRGYENYPAVKCTKHGKEFQSSTHFSADMVEKLYTEGKMVRCGLTEDVKVSTDGKASGIRKRRIQHIEYEVKSMIDELNKLLEKEGADLRYEFKALTPSQV